MLLQMFGFGLSPPRLSLEKIETQAEKNSSKSLDFGRLNCLNLLCSGPTICKLLPIGDGFSKQEQNITTISLFIRVYFIFLEILEKIFI